MLDVLLGQLARPELVIIVHDLIPGASHFSRPSPRIVAEAVAKQPTLWGVSRRVKALLVPLKDQVAQVENIDLFRREESSGTKRCYVLVKGHNFSFGNRLGRDFFDPRSDLRAKFGERDGPHIEAMLQHHFPEIFKSSTD
ncbi:MAG: hypothetical protein RLZZ70_355 [Candidatus Parcubacteria bacterium]|jgi:hypothetical protein